MIYFINDKEIKRKSSQNEEINRLQLIQNKWQHTETIIIIQKITRIPIHTTF